MLQKILTALSIFTFITMSGSAQAQNPCTYNVQLTPDGRLLIELCDLDIVEIVITRFGETIRQMAMNEGVVPVPEEAIVPVNNPTDLVAGQEFLVTASAGLRFRSAQNLDPSTIKRVLRPETKGILLARGQVIQEHDNSYEFWQVTVNGEQGFVVSHINDEQLVYPSHLFDGDIILPGDSVVIVNADSKQTLLCRSDMTHDDKTNVVARLVSGVQAISLAQKTFGDYLWHQLLLSNGQICWAAQENDEYRWIVHNP